MWTFEKRQSYGDRKQMRFLGAGDRSKARLHTVPWIVVMAAQPCRCTKNNHNAHSHWWISRHVNYISVKLCVWCVRGVEKVRTGRRNRKVNPQYCHQEDTRHIFSTITLNSILLRISSEGLLFLTSPWKWSFKFEATNSNSQPTNHLPSRACVPQAL